MAKVAIFRNKIPDLLEKEKITIRELERRTGLSYPTVHPLGRDARLNIGPKTNLETLYLVATALGVTVNDLFTTENNGH